MAEIIGGAASIATVISLVKTCIDIYDRLAEAARADTDLVQAVAQLRLERLKFFFWCESVKLQDGILAMDGTSGQTQIRDQELRQAISPQIQPDLVLREIQHLMNAFIQTMNNSAALLKTYMVTRPPSYLTQLRSKTGRGRRSQSSALVENVNFSGGTAQQKIPNMSRFDRLKWANRDKKKFESLLGFLKSFNEGLNSVLSSAEKISQTRRIQLLATTATPVENIVLAAEASPEQRLLTSPSEEDVIRLIRLAQRSSVIEYDTVDARHSQPPPEPMQSQLQSDRQLASSRLVVENRKVAQDNRMYTTYSNRHVVVEWKYYSHRINPDMLTTLKQRVDVLTVQLQQSAKTTGFNTLNCLGHVDEPQHNRVAIVFSYPEGQEDSKPLTLKDKLVEDRVNYIVPDLEQRAFVASSLVLTFYRLHSVGWLHKSLRSNNVLFFHKPDHDARLLTQPFVCGFNFARQDLPNELTENIPSALVSQYNEIESKIYRHPDLDYSAQHLKPSDPTQLNSQAKEAAKAFRYKRSYDVYSLGILLLEIGHWCPVTEMGSTPQNVSEFRHKIMTKYLPQLRYRMGKKYHDVTERCLKGDFRFFNSDSATSSQTGADEEEEKLDHLRERREWLEMFERYAVRTLEEFTAANS